MPPRLKEFRKVLARNGFACARKRDHEIWVRLDSDGRVAKRVPVPHGNAEIRTARLFNAMLKQADKTEAHFYEVLRRKKSG